jgi:hypothetical protein
MNGYGEAQRLHDRRDEPPEQPKTEWHDGMIDDFIKDFAECGSAPEQWLERNDVAWEVTGSIAEYLQSVAKVWQTQEHAVTASQSFYRLMKSWALEKFDNRELP